MIGPHGLGDFGEVAGPCGRDNRVLRTRMPQRDGRQRAGVELEPVLAELCRNGLIKRRHAIVIETRCDRSVDGHLIRRLPEQLAITLILLAHVAQRVGCTLAIELVDCDKIGKIEHVDFLELRGGAEFGRHHVDRHVGVRHDRGAALADARRLDHHQVEACCFAGDDRIGKRFRDFATGVARR